MAYLNPLTFQQFLQQAATTYNSVATVPANTNQGSALSAIFNAFALLTTAVQGQTIYVANVSRLLTSTGADVDSFVAPFGITRNTASASSGSVTFSTGSATNTQLVILVGTIVQTYDGTQFTVVADATQPGYSSGANGYIIPVGGTSVNATVDAVIPGSSGNVLANTITQIVSTPSNPSPAGVQSVTNPAAFTNGSDQETDAELIARFQSTMLGRWGTDSAIIAAAEGVQTGLTYILCDGTTAGGVANPGSFAFVVNELGQNVGPSSALITDIYNAISAVRPAGMPFTVTGPTLVPVDGTVTVQVNPGYSPSTVAANVQTAFNNLVNSIGLGDTTVNATTAPTYATRLYYSQVISTIEAVAGVVAIPNPPGLTLNGGTVDITAGVGSQIVAGTLTVTTQ